MKKVLSFVLVLTMLFALAVPVHAASPSARRLGESLQRENRHEIARIVEPAVAATEDATEEDAAEEDVTTEVAATEAVANTGFVPLDSYDFTMNFEIRFEMSEDMPQDVELALAMVGGFPLVVESHGTAVMTDALAYEMFMEFALTAGLFTEPFRAWMDVDFNDFASPTLNVVYEIPATIRAMIASMAPEFGVQFFSLDMGDLLVEMLALEGLDFETLLEEALAGFGWDLDTSWAEVDAQLAQMSSADFEAMMVEMIAEMYDEMGIDIDFAFENVVWEVEVNADNHITSMVVGFDMIFVEDGVSVLIGFTMDMDVTNINNATMPAWPVLTADNSLNLMDLI